MGFSLYLLIPMTTFIFVYFKDPHFSFFFPKHFHFQSAVLVLLWRLHNKNRPLPIKTVTLTLKWRIFKNIKSRLCFLHFALKVKQPLFLFSIDDISSWLALTLYIRRVNFNLPRVSDDVQSLILKRYIRYILHHIQ